MYEGGFMHHFVQKGPNMMMVAFFYTHILEQNSIILPLTVIIISIIPQVIIEMCALWLVKDYIISHYNHPVRGDYMYNTESLIFKMATTWFLDVSEEQTNKMKENASALIITWVDVIILKQ